MPIRSVFLLIALSGAGCLAPAADGAATDGPGGGLPAGMTPEAFFTERIRPLLAENCWRCHGPRKQRNGLRLDSRAGVLQGGHGPDVEPGHPERSRLIDAVGYEDGDLQMPPDGRLGDAQLADLATWIRLGVPWAEPAPVEVPASTASGQAGAAR
jgi:mono/diheme cytochrome c family protein